MGGTFFSAGISESIFFLRGSVNPFPAFLVAGYSTTKNSWHNLGTLSLEHPNLFPSASLLLHSLLAAT
jgi:hypothetical protein